MTFVVAMSVLGFLSFEGLRWMLRPEARRLRVLKKIGGRR